MAICTGGSGELVLIGDGEAKLSERTRHEYVFFVGPRKTGTTAFYEILRGKGASISPNVKESFFFDRIDPDLLEYPSRFGLDPSRPFIEVSPSYFTSDVARTNIARLFPGARIVVTLRHPVRRSLSAILHAARIGSLTRAEIERPSLDSKHVRNALDGSSYSRHLVRWGELFPGRVLILRQGEDGTYPEAAVAALGEFIGIPISASELAARRVNQARSPRFPGIIRVVRSAKQFLVRMNAYRLIRHLKVFEPLLFRRPHRAEGRSAENFFATHLAREARIFESSGASNPLPCRVRARG